MIASTQSVHETVRHHWHNDKQGGQGTGNLVLIFSRRKNTENFGDTEKYLMLLIEEVSFFKIQLLTLKY